MLEVSFFRSRLSLKMTVKTFFSSKILSVQGRYCLVLYIDLNAVLTAHFVSELFFFMNSLGQGMRSHSDE